MGFDPVVAPIFALRPLAWQPPDPADFDALLFTSGNAARLGGSGLDRLRQLRCYAVGEATGAAAAAAGFGEIRIGSGNAAAVTALAAADGVSRLLHLCGREHKPLAATGVAITSCIVYAADAIEPLPASAIRALRDRTVVLLHSPRTASHFAALVRISRHPEKPGHTGRDQRGGRGRGRRGLAGKGRGDPATGRRIAGACRQAVQD